MKRKMVNRARNNKKKIFYSLFALLVIAILLIGYSRAWFYNKLDMATLVSVSPPDPISILGPGGSEMTSLDLNYTEADTTKDGDKTKITIRRVICVQSGAAQHQLEVVHTTNLKGLTFKLYQAKDITNEQNESSNQIIDGVYTYSYDASSEISGSYINLDNSQTSDYKYARDTKHDHNFKTYNNVQAHAEPIYWKVNGNLQADLANDVEIDKTNNHRTYYVCEISWLEESEKETDLFYILARTAS